MASRKVRPKIEVRGIRHPGLNADLGLERHFREIQSVLVHAPQEDSSVAIPGRASFNRWKSAKNERAYPSNLAIAKTA